jgi:hypothetical protein
MRSSTIPAVFGFLVRCRRSLRSDSSAPGALPAPLAPPGRQKFGVDRRHIRLEETHVSTRFDKKATPSETLRTTNSARAR